jgi:hypothetical protein
MSTRLIAITPTVTQREMHKSYMYQLAIHDSLADKRSEMRASLTKEGPKEGEKNEGGNTVYT